MADTSCTSGPLSNHGVQRRQLHQRDFQLTGWKREDGLWDLEGRLTDRKTHDYTLGPGVRQAGEAVHDMWIRLAIDNQFNVVAVEAHSQAVPYPGACEAIVPSYQQLVGLNLMQDFRRQVQALFGSVKGCSHLTELLMVLPAVAFQTFASEMTEAALQQATIKPFPLDKCHALETTTETVRRYYPSWYRGSSGA